MWTQSKSCSEIEEMDTSDNYVVTDNYAKKEWHWFYLDELGTWHMFKNNQVIVDFLTSEVIERHYTSNPMGIFQLSTSTGGTKLDFAEMVMTEIKTGKQRQIKRFYETLQTGIGKRCYCDKGSSVPSHWDAMDPNLPYQVFSLKRDTVEYTYVVDFLTKEGLLNRHFKSICRIQNLDLWEFYCRKKTQMERIQGITDVKEMQLFHGTKFSNIHTICTYNFDCRLAGKTGHLYGKGTYFARFASYADNYSPWQTDPVPVFGDVSHGFLDSHMTKIMFLARVIVGKTTVGKSKFLKPDHQKTMNYHDSCVDSVKHPTIFVIFDPNQIYPEYLIQYY